MMNLTVSGVVVGVDWTGVELVEVGVVEVVVNVEDVDREEDVNEVADEVVEAINMSRQERTGGLKATHRTARVMMTRKRRLSRKDCQEQ
jgi:hypothetical protein